jgi:hypothetical protein
LEVTDNLTARTEAFVSPGEIAGFNPQPDPPGFVRVAFDYGMVGIGFAQEAQLHLVSVPSPTISVEVAAAAATTCHATLRFLDGSGQVVTNRRGVPITKDVDIAPGGSAELTLDGSNFVSLGSRLLLRAQVSSPTVNGFPPDPCLNFTSDLEIVNAESARTSHFVSPAAIHGFNPQPDPPGAPAIGVE